MVGLAMNYDQLKSDLVKIQYTFGSIAALPKFFRKQITLRQAEEGLKKLLDSHDDRFLEMMRRQVYETQGSPYLKLLKYAGCEFADLESSVNRQGLENTLAKLAGEGVYFTSDEFKGKSEVVRGGMSFGVSSKDFHRPKSVRGYTSQSSGTRNLPVSTLSSLEWLSIQTMGEAIFYSTHNLLAHQHAVYEPIIGGFSKFTLIRAKLGLTVHKRFNLNVGTHSLLEAKYHWLYAYLVGKMGSWFGPGIAKPEYLEPGDIKPIIEWIRENNHKGQSSCIRAVVSNGVKIARAALEEGISLEHLTFEVGGEPLTQSKKRLFDEARARVALRYGPGGDSGTMYGCGNANFIDELHVPQSVVSLVNNPRILDDGDSPIHPLMQTSLHPAAPRFLFNVEMGDYATLIERDCGCPLQKVGFTQHVHSVRSFEKMTGEGVNYSGSDLFELLEETIPSEFGGGPGDYQIVEEEDDRGQTRLTLVVHPEVKNVNEEKLLRRLQQGLAQESRNHRFISKIWQDAGTFRFRRAIPHTSARGKILPLHIRQKV